MLLTSQSLSDDLDAAEPPCEGAEAEVEADDELRPLRSHSLMPGSRQAGTQAPSISGFGGQPPPPGPPRCPPEGPPDQAPLEDHAPLRDHVRPKLELLRSMSAGRYSSSLHPGGHGDKGRATGRQGQG